MYSSAVSGETMKCRNMEVWAMEACKSDKPPGICFYHGAKTPSPQYGWETSTPEKKELSSLDNYN